VPSVLHLACRAVTCGKRAGLASVAVHRSAWTTDGRVGVLVHEDQTAELCDERGPIILGRSPMHTVGAQLVELGYDPPTC
jgi:hypothetical protein